MENFQHKPKEMSEYSIEEAFSMIKKGGIEVGMQILEAKEYDIENPSKEFFDTLSVGLLYAVKNGNNNLSSFKATVGNYTELMHTTEIQEAIQHRVAEEVKNGQVRFMADNNDVIDFDNELIKQAMISGILKRIENAKHNKLLP